MCDLQEGVKSQQIGLYVLRGDHVYVTFLATNALNTVTDDHVHSLLQGQRWRDR